jgi:peroxiredoxin Q/BCP
MSEPLAEGVPAPEFDLPGDGGGRIRLSAFRGSPVVVYFYPKNDTSGCTREAIAFSQLKPQFDAAAVTVIGVSADPPAKHDAFKKKHDLSIRLASDEAKSVLEAYGVWVEKSMYGRRYMGIERSTFLIDGSGSIARIWRKVRVPGHGEAVLAAAKAL